MIIKGIKNINENREKLNQLNIHKPFKTLIREIEEKIFEATKKNKNINFIKIYGPPIENVEEVKLYVRALDYIQGKGYIDEVENSNTKYAEYVIDKEQQITVDYIYWEVFLIRENIIIDMKKSGLNINRNIYYTHYDSVDKIIYFNKKIEVKIAPKTKDSDAVRIWETLYEDVYKTYNNDTLKESWGYSVMEKTVKNKFYEAARKLNRIIQKKIDIEEFVKATTKYVEVNKKYLK